MNRLIVASFCATALAGGVLLSAQGLQLPSEPKKAFGGSVTPAFDGWFENADGTRSFLVGYFSRNTEQTLDIPIGPNNRIEPGGPDLGQPTHFLPGRNVGMLVVTVPKDFTLQQRLTWTLTANGQTNSVPFRLHTDYNVSPFGDKDTPGQNTPPVIRFEEKGPTTTGPRSSALRPTVTRTTSMATPLALNIWADDDAKYSSGTNAPMRNVPPPVDVMWSKYRGPGTITFDNAKPKLETLKGGKVAEPYSGKATTTAKFSEPGDYVILAMVTDFSGFGGGGEVCCWTTALIKVTVTK